MTSPEQMRPAQLLNTLSAEGISDAMSRHMGTPDENGCIPWLGTINPSTGYGQFAYRSKRFPAHRAAYVAKYGPIQVGMDACHKCDRRDCVNPDHIFPGTRADNMRDCSEKNRLHAQVSPETIARHEKSGRSKLTLEAARFIRANTQYSAGYLAKVLGVDQTTVSDIRRGETWREDRSLKPNEEKT